MTVTRIRIVFTSPGKATDESSILIAWRLSSSSKTANQHRLDGPSGTAIWPDHRAVYFYSIDGRNYEPEEYMKIIRFGQ